MRRTPQKREARYSLKSRIDKSCTHSDLSIFDTALSNDLRKMNSNTAVDPENGF